MLLHAVHVMRNHYHLVVTDVHGRLPEFMHWLNLHTCKALNVFYRRTENLWSVGSYSAVALNDIPATDDFRQSWVVEPLETIEDIIRAMDYVFLNAVEAEHVNTRFAWPGIHSSYRDLEKTVFAAERPGVYFDPNGTLPQSRSFRLVRPPQLSTLSDAEFQDWIQEGETRLNEKERQIQKRLQRGGRSFLGSKGVLAQSPFDFPRGKVDRLVLNPHLAGIRRENLLARITELKRFRAEYRAALTSYRAGQVHTTFPVGTYWMRVYYSVACRRPAICAQPLPILATGPPN